MDTTPLCKVCQDRGFVHYDVWIDDPRFGKAYPCPACKPAKKTEFFSRLERVVGNEKAISFAEEWARHPAGWLVLNGAVGTGKTRLLSAVLSFWRGEPRMPQSAAEVLDVWRMALDEELFGSMFVGACEAEVAVLDDLGAERPTEWALERLTMYLDFRYGRGLPTLIATNHDRASMAQALGERIADRVFDQGTGLVSVVSLTNPSWRR